MLISRKHSLSKPVVIYSVFNTHLGTLPKGRAMGILAYRKQRKDLNSALQIMRNHGIAVSGPYRRQNGTLMFSVADDVVTEDELLRMPQDERLEPNNVHELLAKIKKRPT